MAANVENMFSVREIPWHGQGTILEQYPTYEAAIKAAGLQWDVEKVQAVQLLADGTVRKLDGEFEIRRVTDGQHYGFVKETYVPFQNQELFDLSKEMIGLGAKIETAGSLDKGRVTWMCAMTEGSVFAEEFIQDYYILTLAAVGMELRLRGLNQACVHLAVGLPLTWVGEQKEDFKAYLLQNKEVDFTFRGESFHVEFVGADVLPQGLSAVEICSRLNEMRSRVYASFIMDRLDYMQKGGRCSSVVALGGKLLRIKPEIAVVDGTMKMVDKYVPSSLSSWHLMPA